LAIGLLPKLVWFGASVHEPKKCHICSALRGFETPLGNFPQASIVNVDIGGKGHFKRLNDSTRQVSILPPQQSYQAGYCLYAGESSRQRQSVK
jgi:hypothetical protein